VTRAARSVRAGIAICLALWLSGCTGACDRTRPPVTEPGTATAENANDPQWVFRDPQHPNKVAVVFVHGIFGDTKGTWTNANGSTFFDFVHQLPDIGAKVDVYAFGFSSHMLANGSLKIGEAANKLHDYLLADGVTKYDEIVFVAHSMGGLITMRELISHDDVRAKVPVLVLYATPHEGSQISTIGRVLLNNPALQQMLPVDANDYLQQINEDWVRVTNATPHPVVICAYEKKPVGGTIVVPWASSTRNCSRVASAIEDSDHLSIVKPDRARHPSVIVLANALNEFVAPTLDAASFDTPKFSKESDHWVYMIENAANRNTAVFQSRISAPLSYTFESDDPNAMLVLPEAMPRHVASNGRDSVDMILMGPLRPEYRLRLRVGAAPEQVVIARIPDMAAAIAQRNQFESGTVEYMNAYFDNSQNKTSFQSLTGDGQQQKLASLADEAIRSQNPELPSEARLILAATTLNGLNLANGAAASLAALESRFPDVARTASVQHLAGVVAARTGKSKVLKNVVVPAVSAAEAMPAPERANRSDAQLLTLSQLAVHLQAAPATRAEATVLRGDILAVSGNTTAATQVYRAAAEAPTATPAARERARRGAAVTR